MHNRYLKTEYIFIDTKQCRACWKCIKQCSKKVVGKVNLFFHKHARFINTNECTGCQKCIKVCEFGAIKSLRLK